MRELTGCINSTFIRLAKPVQTSSAHREVKQGVILAISQQGNYTPHIEPRFKGAIAYHCDSILIPACADICKQYKSPLTGKPVLLVAAGGMNDGRSVAAALMLGASGVWVGTRFIPSVESKYPEAAKQQ
jgi:hypothetical protein